MYFTLKTILLGAAVAAAAPAAYNATLTQRSTLSFPPNSTNGTAQTNGTQRFDQVNDIDGETIFDVIRKIYGHPKYGNVTAPANSTAPSNATVPANVTAPANGTRLRSFTDELKKCNVDGYAECQHSGRKDCDAELDKSGECRIHDVVKGLLAKRPRLPEAAILFDDGDILLDGKVIGNIRKNAWSVPGG